MMPALARTIRKAAEGIGWIFQFGMGYTFYLPVCLLCGGPVVLVVHRDQACEDGASGRVWSRIDVYCRLCVAVFQFDADGGARGDAVDAWTGSGAMDGIGAGNERSHGQ